MNPTLPQVMAQLSAIRQHNLARSSTMANSEHAYLLVYMFHLCSKVFLLPWYLCFYLSWMYFETYMYFPCKLFCTGAFLALRCSCLGSQILPCVFCTFGVIEYDCFLNQSIKKRSFCVILKLTLLLLQVTLFMIWFQYIWMSLEEIPISWRSFWKAIDFHWQEKYRSMGLLTVTASLEDSHT